MELTTNKSEVENTTTSTLSNSTLANQQTPSYSPYSGQWLISWLEPFNLTVSLKTESTTNKSDVETTTTSKFSSSTLAHMQTPSYSSYTGEFRVLELRTLNSTVLLLTAKLNTNQSEIATTTISTFSTSTLANQQTPSYSSYPSKL